MRRMFVPFFNVLALIVLLSGCSTPLDLAENAYQEGQYTQSLLHLANYVDEQSGDLSDKETSRTTQLIQNIEQHYAQQLQIASTQDYEQQISINEDILMLQKRLEPLAYYTPLRLFTDKYPTHVLHQTLVKLYYDKGNTIKGTKKENYRDRTFFFEKGMSHNATYKDIAKKFATNDKQYRTLYAQDYYREGQQYANKNLYIKAAEQFKQAADIYSKYGDYKKSAQLATEYRRKHYHAESTRTYDEAKQKAALARTHADYRDVSKRFDHAYHLYSEFGVMKDSRSLAQSYAAKGRVKVYIQQANYFSSQLSSRLKADYIEFVNNASSADIVIKVTQDFNFKKDKDKTTKENLTETIKENNVAKNYAFVKESVLSKNRSRLKFSLTATGDLTYQTSYSVERTSESTKITYSGNVPSKYKNETKGKLLKESDLNRKAQEKVMDDLKDDIRKLVKLIETI